MMASNGLLELQGISRRYHQGERELPILDGAQMSLKRGEMVALVAPSGACCAFGRSW
jgi:lipoprotein-releasing system ATP-binding protein